MSDPIERLSRLGSDFPVDLEGRMLPPHEIRRRGDRIRRRHHALVAVGSVAAAAVIAVPVVALAGNSDDGRVDPAPEPTVTETPARTSSTLSRADLVTDADTGSFVEGSTWHTSHTGKGDGHAPANPCQSDSLAGLGADAVFTRDFELRDDAGDVVPTGWMTALVAQFDDGAAARDAYDTFLTWVAECDSTLAGVADNYTVVQEESVNVPVGEASGIVSAYGPVEGDPAFDNVMETGLVLLADRVAVLTTHVLAPNSCCEVGWDYDFTNTQMKQVLPAAAERLQPDSAPPEPEPEPSGPGAGSWPTELPDGFPLASGLPEPSAEDASIDGPSRDLQAMVAAGELEACGQGPDAGDPLDRLTTRLTAADSGTTREIQLFADDDAASSYVASIGSVYEACPTEDSGGSPPTFTTTVGEGAFGDESLDIRRASDGIGRTVVTVARVGNAVLVEVTGDPGAGEQVDELATEAHENLADVMAALHELQATASPDPSLTEPASTNEIPAGFPLDAALGEPPTGETVEGPAPGVLGVSPENPCGVGNGIISYDANRTDRLGYAAGGLTYDDRRTLLSFPTVQAAVEEMELLKRQVADCDRDRQEGALADRVWRVFDGAQTGYDSVIFSWTYEEANGVGAPAGSLYTVVRVGNGVLAVEWSGEGGADYRAGLVDSQLELVGLITPEMCVFTVDGC